MKKQLKFITIGAFTLSAVLLSGCASVKTLKAPCGPLAGMTDPCGNRLPINSDDERQEVIDDFVKREQV